MLPLIRLCVNVYKLKYIGDENAFYYKVVPWVIQVLGSTCMYDPWNKFVVKSISIFN